MSLFLSKKISQNLLRKTLSMILMAVVNVLALGVFANHQETTDESSEKDAGFSSQNVALATYVIAAPDIEELSNNVIPLSPTESVIKNFEVATVESTNSLVPITSPLDTKGNIAEKKPKAEEMTQTEKLLPLITQTWSKGASYIVIDGASPTMLKEFIKKSVNKGIRNAAFVGPYKAAYNSAESGIRLRRSLVELVRNTNRLILSEKAQGNYPEAGKIIRTSLLGHIIIAAPQVAVSFLVPHGFVKAGLPPQVGGMVESYLKWGNLGVTAKELTGKTGENILMLEHPELEFLPALTNAGLMIIIYYGGGKLLPAGQLPRLAMSEALAMSGTTVGLLAFLNYNEEYQKYQLFDAGNDTWSDYVESFKKIKDYSIPFFVTNICCAITESSDVLMDAIIGGESALKARGVFTFFSLFISPISLANAQQSGRSVAKSLATNETDAVIKHQMQQGLLTNFLVSAPYFVCVLAPSLVYRGHGDNRQGGIIRILAATNIISAMQGTAKEQLSAFKIEERSRLKTVGDITAVTVPIGGVILFKTGAINPNLQNRLIVQIIALLPAILTISEAVLYAS